MLDALLELAPEAKVGFIGLERDHASKLPREYYCKLPEPGEHSLAVLIDPMLATGNSLAGAIELLKSNGFRRILVITILSAPEGKAVIESRYPEIEVYTGSLDERLDENKYIVPGLGRRRRPDFRDHRTVKSLLAALAALLLLPCPGGEVEILCTTDLHGRAEEFAALAPLLRKNPAAIRIDCGDTLQGTLLSRLSSGRIMISLLNELGYDVWVPGNHDFEFGPEPLVSAAREFRGATLGAEFARDGFRPGAWVLLVRNGYRIAVTGMTDPKMPSPGCCRVPAGASNRTATRCAASCRKSSPRNRI